MKALLKKMIRKDDDEDKDKDKGDKDKKEKTKEAEKVVFPNFPQPENFCNWRLGVREAVVAASNKPDHAFKWLSKVWDKETKVDDLRDTDGFATLDAKVLSAITNVLEGEFARQIYSFKEREAHAGRLVRGRQVWQSLMLTLRPVLCMVPSMSLRTFLGVKLINANLVTFMSNWDTVLSGMKVAPDDKFLEPLFHRQIKKCKSISHDVAIYERATEGAKERSYSFLSQAASNCLARRRLDRNRERMARQLGDDKPALPAAKRVPKVFCISFVKNGSCKVDNCKYKHQIPDGRKDRSQSRGRGGRSQSRRRTGSPSRLESRGFVNSTNKAVVAEARTASSCTQANLVPGLYPTQKGVREEALIKAERTVRTGVARTARSPDLAPRAQRGHAIAKAPRAVRAQVKGSDPRRQLPLLYAS